MAQTFLPPPGERRASTSSGRPTRVRFGVLAFLALAMGSAYLTRACIGTVATSIQADLRLDSAQMGEVMAAFSFGYLWLQVPGGWLGNRFGARRMLSLFAVAWSLCSLWGGMAGGLANLWAARAVMGLSQAGLIPVSARATQEWFPPTRRGSASSVLAAAMSLGAVVAAGLTAWLLSRGMGWRQIFTSYTLVGIVWSAAFYFWFRNRPHEHPAVNAAERELIQGKPGSVRGDAREEAVGPKRRNRAVLLAMITSSSMWLICVQAFFRSYGAIFFQTWFPTYLQKGRGFDLTQAGFLSMLPLTGLVIGSLAGGAIVDRVLAITGSKWASRSGTAVAFHALCALFIYLATLTQNPHQAVWLIAAGALCSGMGQPCTWTATMDIAGPHTAVVFGIMNSIGNLGALVSPIMVGNLIKQIEETGGSWNAVLYLFAGIYVAATLSWAALNPNRSAVERAGAVRSTG